MECALVSPQRVFWPNLAVIVPFSGKLIYVDPVWLLTQAMNYILVDSSSDQI